MFALEFSVFEAGRRSINVLRWQVAVWAVQLNAPDEQAGCR